jgi:hypothetical protein
MIAMTVKVSAERWAEVGEPSKSLLLAKLERPTESRGIRKRIMKIKNRLTRVPKRVNINLRV